MVNAQKWLNNQSRKTWSNLNISNKNLESPLKIEGFIRLQELICSHNQISQLKISNCPNLEVVKCHQSQTTELVIQNCPKLKELRCANNLLTNLDLRQLGRDDVLEILNIGNNNFSEQNLSFLSHLVNLQKLWIGNTEKERIQQGIYNRFFGSLESVQNMTNLDEFGIANTDIDHGLEYLSDSVKDFACLADKKRDAKVQSIANLFSNEQGTVEVDGLGQIIDFSPQLQVYKKELPQMKQVKEQIKSRVEEILIKEKISSEQVNQQLMEIGYLKDNTQTWQDYLEIATSLTKISVREKYVLLAIRILKDRVQINDLTNKVQELTLQIQEYQTQIQVSPKK